MGKRIQNTEWRALGGGAREIEVSAATLRARQLFQPSTFLPPATLCTSQLVSVGPSKADVVLFVVCVFGKHSNSRAQGPGEVHHAGSDS